MARGFIDRIIQISKTIYFKFVLIYTLLNASIVGSILGVERELFKNQKDLIVDGEDFSFIANFFGDIFNLIIMLIQIVIIIAFYIVMTVIFNIFFTRYSLTNNRIANTKEYLNTLNITMIIESLFSLIIYFFAFGLLLGLISFIFTILYLPLYTYLYHYLKVNKYKNNMGA